MLAALLGCQALVLAPTPPDCPVDPPDAATVRAGWVQCAAQIPDYGEGRADVDAILATSRFRVILHDDAAAFTVPDLGGGTILDAAAWDQPDLVHEIVPIVGGGWLIDAVLTAATDGITVEGTVAPLPDRPATAVGERRSVRYHAEPGSPFLEVDGAEGFWIDPGGDEQLLRGLAVADGRVVGGMGEVVDHGGVFEVLGTDRLLISDTAHAWADVAGDAGIPVAGVAPDADTLALYAAGQVIGRVAIGPTFATTIPADVDQVRAEAVGRGPSPFAAPSGALDLPVGPAGSVVFAPTWLDGRDHWFRVGWTAGDGRAGTEVLPPEGGELLLGAGSYALEVTAGPALGAQALAVVLAPGEVRTVPLHLVPTLDADRFVRATFRLPDDHSRDWRGSDQTALELAASDGASYATFTPVDDVGVSVGDLSDAGPLRTRVGVELRGAGYTIAAWPWTASTKKPLHGGPQFGGYNPRDDAAILSGGPDDDRTLSVDLGWLALVEPHDADPVPDQVWLAAPGGDLAGFDPWFHWLDAQVFLLPTGPTTWIPVDDPRDPGAADIEQGLNRGELCAGTGPLLLLTVDGAVPGETLAPGGPLVEVEIEVRNAGTADRLAIVGDHGARWDLPFAARVSRQHPRPARWLAVATWSAADPDGTWAITAPVWTSAP